MVSISSYLTRSVMCMFGVLRVIGAEQHRVKFDNRCGHGTVEPHLLKDGKILSQGEEFVSNGSFTSGIAYLQTGNCNLNGEGCTLVEMTLINPVCPGCGSSAGISLIPPLAYSVPTSFRYLNGCDGHGAACFSPDCKTAFFVPNDNHVQVQCQEHDVDLLISFCAGSPDSVPTKKPRPTALPITPKVHVVQSVTTVESRSSVATTTASQNHPGTANTAQSTPQPGPAPPASVTNFTAGKRKCSATHAERRTSGRRNGGMHRKRTGHLGGQYSF